MPVMNLGLINVASIPVSLLSSSFTFFPSSWNEPSDTMATSLPLSVISYLLRSEKSAFTVFPVEITSFFGIRTTTYFDKAHIQGDSAQIIVDVSFGSVELFVPKNWNIIKSADSSFGGIEEKNNNAVKDGPTVYLEGDISFSGVTIYYI